MLCPSSILCPVYPTVITDVNAGPTKTLTSQLAAVLTYNTPGSDYFWFTHTYLPYTPTDSPISAFQHKSSEPSYPTHHETSSHTITSATGISRGQSKSDIGLNIGPMVGIAVACATIGAIVSAIITCLVLRRRRQKHTDLKDLPLGYNEGEKHLSTVPIEEKEHIHDFLLDRKPDEKIGAELKSLGYLIQQHVEDHCHLRSTQCNPGLLPQSLTRLGIDRNADITTDHLASLALNPETRYVAIRHVIAKVAFTSVTMDGTPPISLLPLCATSFNLMDMTIGRVRGDLEARQLALTKWRQLSAFLLHPDHSDRSPLVPSEDISTQQAQELAVAINEFIMPFINSGDREARYEQENNLREVIVECATFGYLLFSQPSEFRFRFDSDEGQKKIVVCPGIEKISDEQGRRYTSRVQPIMTPMVESAGQA